MDVTIKNSKRSTGKTGTPISKKTPFKALPSFQLLQSLNLHQPAEQSSTVKKLNVKPVRGCDIANFDEFTKPPEVTTTTRNVRKRLWSVKKEDNNGTLEKSDKKRRGTLMKPSIRKTIYNKPSLIQTKKNTIKTQTMDNTLPLIDMEQFTVTKISRSLFPASQKLNVPQRKTMSQMNLNKKPFASNVAKKIIKPTPSIVITPAERSVEKPSVKTTSNIKPKEKKDETIDGLFKKLTIIEEQVKTFNEVLLLLCNHLGIEVPNKCGKEKSPNKKTKTSPCIKREVSSAPTDIKTEFKLTSEKIICETNESIHNNTPCDKDRSIETNTKTNEKCDEPILNNEETNNMEKAEISVKISLNPQEVCTPKTDQTINKTASTIKFKKTWITQFEQLENKLLSNSNMSINLNSSPDDSPVSKLHLNEIVNNNEINPIALIKSQSTSNLEEGNASQRKSTLFKSRETADLLTESICGYNELRDELPKFLTTPVSKTNKTMSLMTPSVQGNEKKLISRRVQEQILKLNNCL